MVHHPALLMPINPAPSLLMSIEPRCVQRHEQSSARRLLEHAGRQETLRDTLRQVHICAWTCMHMACTWHLLRAALCTRRMRVRTDARMHISHTVILPSYGHMHRQAEANASDSEAKAKASSAAQAKAKSTLLSAERQLSKLKEESTRLRLSSKQYAAGEKRLCKSMGVLSAQLMESAEAERDAQMKQAACLCSVRVGLAAKLEALLTCSLAHLLTCSLAHLLTCSLAHLLTCLPYANACSLAHLLALCLPTCSLAACSPAFLQRCVGLQRSWRLRGQRWRHVWIRWSSSVA